MVSVIPHPARRFFLVNVRRRARAILPRELDFRVVRISISPLGWPSSQAPNRCGARDNLSAELERGDPAARSIPRAGLLPYKRGVCAGFLPLSVAVGSGEKTPSSRAETEGHSSALASFRFSLRRDVVTFVVQAGISRGEVAWRKCRWRVPRSSGNPTLITLQRCEIGLAILRFRVLPCPRLVGVW